MLRMLIVGAGEAGTSIVDEMMRNPRSPYVPTGFIDDDKGKHGLNIHGVRVLGGREVLPTVLKHNDIDEILIAIPSADSKQIRKLVTLIKEAGWKKRYEFSRESLISSTVGSVLKILKK